MVTSAELKLLSSGAMRAGVIEGIGAGLAALAGVGGGLLTYRKYYGANALSDYFKTIVGGTISTGQERPAEIMHLFKNYPPDGSGWTPLKYLRYKFLGAFEGEESAWSLPFWASLAVFIGAKVACYFGVAPGITKPIERISTGALIVSTIGALALPGCDGLTSVIADGVTEALTLS